MFSRSKRNASTRNGKSSPLPSSPPSLPAKPTNSPGGGEGNDFLTPSQRFAKTGTLNDPRFASQYSSIDRRGNSNSFYEFPSNKLVSSPSSPLPPVPPKTPTSPKSSKANGASVIARPPRTSSVSPSGIQAPAPTPVGKSPFSKPFPTPSTSPRSSIVSPSTSPPPPPKDKKGLFGAVGLGSISDAKKGRFVKKIISSENIRSASQAHVNGTLAAPAPIANGSAISLEDLGPDPFEKSPENPRTLPPSTALGSAFLQAANEGRGWDPAEIGNQIKRSTSAGGGTGESRGRPPRESQQFDLVALAAAKDNVKTGTAGPNGIESEQKKSSSSTVVSTGTVSRPSRRESLQQNGDSVSFGSAGTSLQNNRQIPPKVETFARSKHSFPQTSPRGSTLVSPPPSGLASPVTGPTNGVSRWDGVSSPPFFGQTTMSEDSHDTHDTHVSNFSLPRGSTDSSGDEVGAKVSRSNSRPAPVPIQKDGIPTQRPPASPSDLLNPSPLPNRAPTPSSFKTSDPLQSIPSSLGSGSLPSIPVPPSQSAPSKLDLLFSSSPSTQTPTPLTNPTPSAYSPLAAFLGKASPSPSSTPAYSPSPSNLSPTRQSFASIRQDSSSSGGKPDSDLSNKRDSLSSSSENHCDPFFSTRTGFPPSSEKTAEPLNGETRAPSIRLDTLSGGLSSPAFIPSHATQDSVSSKKTVETTQTVTPPLTPKALQTSIAPDNAAASHSDTCSAINSKLGNSPSTIPTPLTLEPVKHLRPDSAAKHDSGSSIVDLYCSSPASTSPKFAIAPLNEEVTNQEVKLHAASQCTAAPVVTASSEKQVPAEGPKEAPTQHTQNSESVQTDRGQEDSFGSRKGIVTSRSGQEVNAATDVPSQFSKLHKSASAVTAEDVNASAMAQKGVELSKSRSAESPVRGQLRAVSEKLQMYEDLQGKTKQQPNGHPPRSSSQSASRSQQQNGKRVSTTGNEPPVSHKPRPPKSYVPPRRESSRMVSSANNTSEESQDRNSESENPLTNHEEVNKPRDRKRERPSRSGKHSHPEKQRPRSSTHSRRSSGIERRSQYSSIFEYAIIEFANPLLSVLLNYIGYADFRALRELSKTMRQFLYEREGKEIILLRFLGPVGYRLPPPTTYFRSSMTLPTGVSVYEAKNADGTTTHSKSPIMLPNRNDHVNVGLRDLDAYKAGTEFTPGEFALFARQLPDLSTLRMLKASTRAWNRIVLRVRSQSSDIMYPPPKGYPNPPNVAPICKRGRAPVLRVWVPAKSTWMSDEELVECEREIFRSGVWQNLKRGDCVWNIALGDFGNEGKLLFDGKYLRDLQYAYDPIGHLPSWINMFSVSPSYYHNVITSSTPNPVMYLCLAPFVQAIRGGLALCQDKIEINGAGGSHTIKKFVYRTSFKVTPGTIIGSDGGAGGRGPGGIEIITEEWAGQVVIETEGTTEHAKLLIQTCLSTECSPWRILRERSRPGKLWIRPCLENERIS